jgi:hypothetical protein
MYIQMSVFHTNIAIGSTVFLFCRRT